eukprot:2398005-Rhodomonas_salina.1
MRLMRACASLTRSGQLPLTGDDIKASAGERSAPVWRAFETYCTGWYHYKFLVVLLGICSTMNFQYYPSPITN